MITLPCTKTSAGPLPANATDHKDTKMDIYPAGSRPSQQGPDAYFTGTVRLDPVVNAPAPARINAALVTFEPQARTAWHTHPLGQTLHVISGAGWICQEGAPRQNIRPGDTIFIPPNIRHWHGATDTTAMCHMAIQENDDSGTAVTWLEKVSDAEYA